MDAYLVAVIILLLLAIGDLVVGVSNDAVNFLVSAVGSRVAPRRVILGIAAAGVFVGAVFSSGMMEVARKGIFDPSFFSFADIMVIFLAVMITDILLLDLYNSLGLPTSTTVSIIFELLGAAVVIGWLVIGRGETDATSVLELINQGKVVEIIAGIFLSVALAFSIGALVQWISRLLFTFHLDRRMRRYGALFAGIAITFIAYFMLVKGLKGSALASDELLGWVKANTTMLMALVFVVVTLAVFALQRTLGLHPLKLVVLAGTFTLAMAFAGNDLVNFVGVPITAFQSYELWKASGVDAHGFMMDQLAGQVRTPTLLLLIAGLVMTVTLWVSGKARKVTDTAVNLGRQGKGEEKFRSHALARAIVRRAQWSNRIFSHVLGRRNRILIRMRFRNHGLLV
ncbi:MAG TPA: inorganic phosphate transporter, partial [Flavobacteriales bacterium]|nr:inorganic phosphate transporter [Flavobacteriales bacterium]